MDTETMDYEIDCMSDNRRMVGRSVSSFQITTATNVILVNSSPFVPLTINPASRGSTDFLQYL